MRKLIIITRPLRLLVSSNITEADEKPASVIAATDRSNMRFGQKKERGVAVKRVQQEGLRHRGIVYRHSFVVKMFVAPINKDQQAAYFNQ